MSESGSLLIQRAEVSQGVVVDLRCRAGFITERTPMLSPSPRDEVIDAKGGALIPGLNTLKMRCHSL